MKSILAPTEMLFFLPKTLNQRNRRGTFTPPENLLQDSKSIIHMKKRLLRMSVSLCLEFEAPFFVKVKAHLRHLGGKVVKVRSCFRRVRGRQED